MKKLVQGAKRAGPYLLVELLLPGGSLVALAMLLAAHRKNLRNPDVDRTQPNDSDPRFVAPPQ